MRRAVGVALAGELREGLAVEEQVGGLVAMPAGDDDGARAERVDGAGELLPVQVLGAGAGEHARLLAGWA